MKKLFAVMFLFSFSMVGWSQLSQDQVLELLAKNSPEQATKTLVNEGIGFQMDDAFLAQLAKHPKVLSLLLNKFLGKNRAVVVTKPLTAAEVNTDPNALVIQKIYELANNLSVSNRLEANPEVIDRRLGFRDFMVRAVMEPNHTVTLNQIKDRLGSNDFLPTWVEDLVNKSVAGKDAGYPQVQLTANRSANLALPSSDRGIHGYLGLYMVKGDPNKKDFSLEENLVYSHPDFPMVYDTKKEAFEPGKIEKRSITTLKLTKIFKERGSLELYPGTWGIRFKHTTGNHSMRSDQTAYVTVEPGKSYDLKFAWETNDKGNYEMKMTLVPR